MTSDTNVLKILDTTVLLPVPAARAVPVPGNSGQTSGGGYSPPTGNAVNAPAIAAATAAATAPSATAASGGAAVKPAAATKAAAPRTNDARTLVDQLNKHLNDSGRSDEYRVDPDSGGKLIQQINPANGAVLGEFSVDEFPALARSVGASGLLVDSLA
jgi:hypothetical protein